MKQERLAVLVVVDAQVGLDDPQYGRRSTPSLEANLVSLVSHWRASHHPVVFTKHNSRRPGSPLSLGNPGNEIKSCVYPHAVEQVFEKSTNSAFKVPEFAAWLAALKPSTLVFVGMATDACVTSTAREAMDLGYATVIVSDACATFERTSITEEMHEAEQLHAVSLAALFASGAKVLNTKEALCLATS